VPAHGPRLPSRLPKRKPQKIKASASSWPRMLIVVVTESEESQVLAGGSGESRLMVNNDK